MLLHWREDAEVALNALVVVVTDIIFNHIDQFFLGGKALAVIAFPFQDTPETFHGPVVNALGYAGHTLGHTGLVQLMMEDSVGILKSSVAMEQRMCAGISPYSTVKGFKNQRVVIPVTNLISNNASIISSLHLF